jgi:putative ABC transport system permease protein
MAVAVVACAIALGVAVHTINHSAATELAMAVRSLAGDADLSIRSGRTGFDEGLYAELAARPEIELASPAVEIDAKLAAGTGTLPIMGIDPFRALVLQPALLGEAADRITELLRPNAVMLTRAAATRYGLEEGDNLDVQVGTRSVRLSVIAILPLNDALRQPLALMDIAAAQWVFERLGRLTRIDLRLRPGTDPSIAARELQSLLPPGASAVDPGFAAEQSAALSRAYRVNLNVLALVSLFTGAVLIFGVQVLSALRRRAHFALLRALGLSRRRLLATLVAEATVIGALGTALGVALGLITARIALASSGGDLGAGFFQGIQAAVRLDPVGIGLIAFTGIAACALAGALPAWEAANAAPASALRSGDEQRIVERMPHASFAVAVLAIGSALLLLPPVDRLPIFGYAAMACLLIGAMLLMPVYVRHALAVIPPPRRAVIRLAIEQLRGAHGYAGISLATVLASFSLAVSMLIMIHSFRHSLDAWLTEVLPADVYARAGTGSSAWLDPGMQERLRSAPGVRRAVFSRHQTIELDAARPSVTLIARDLDPARPEALPLVAPQRLPGDGSLPVWVSEATRELYGADVGRRIVLPLAGKNVEATVAGIWRDYVRQGGAVLINRADYVRLTGDRLANDAWLWLSTRTASADAATAALRAVLGAGTEIELRDAASIRALSLGLFDKTFAVTYALQLSALVIALFGIGIGFSAQAYARRAEFGMLRQIGMTRAGLGSMLAVEGALLGLLGALAGLVVGAALSYVLVHVINRQSFHWSMDMHWPIMPLALISAALVLTCALTAAVAARRALSDDALRAPREDW